MDRLVQADPFDVALQQQRTYQPETYMDTTVSEGLPETRGVTQTYTALSSSANSGSGAVGPLATAPAGRLLPLPAPVRMPTDPQGDTDSLYVPDHVNAQGPKYRDTYDVDDTLTDHEASGFAIISHRSAHDMDLHFTKLFPDDAPFEIQFEKISEVAQHLHTILRKPGLLTPIMYHYQEKTVTDANLYTTASIDNARYEAKQDVQLAMSMMESFKTQVHQVKLKVDALEQNA